MRTSRDLRMRVIRFVERGGSKIEAARRFEVGIASVHRWLKAGCEWRPRRPGRPQGRGDKLDREALRRAVEEQPDLMLKELAVRFGVSINTVHHACKTMKLSRKKNGGVRRSETL